MAEDKSDAQREAEEMEAMFNSINKLIGENLTLPVTLSLEDAERLRRFVEKGYVNDVGGTSVERQPLWETALVIHERILMEQMEHENKSEDSITIPLFETQIAELESLTHSGLNFGMMLDERLDVIEAISHTREAYVKSRSEIQGQ
jgi:hypothetical protein